MPSEAELRERIEQALPGAEVSVQDTTGGGDHFRAELSSLSGWPTIPQLFVEGELVGGCDIVMEMFESGDLAETLGVEQPDLDEAPTEPEHEQLPQRQSGIGLENRLG